MVKVSILKVYQPNVFLGTDLGLFEKINQACNQLKIGDTLLLSCNNVTPQMVFLYECNNQYMRIRVLSAINPNTFRCLLIDFGRIEEVKKHRMFVIPLNQLQMDPAVKLYKITGIVPVGLNISNEGASIKAKLSETREWIRASYKFVCHIFQENACVHVSYIKECSKDKALVEVYVNYKDERENLKDLLIREHYAMAVEEDQNKEMQGGLSCLSLIEDEDKVNDDSNDSIAGESISRILDEYKEDDQDNFSIVSKGTEISDTSLTPDNSDSLTINKSSFGTLDEISSQVLNNKVKSWLVSKSVEINSNDETVVKYEYKNPVRAILSYQKDQMISPFLKDTMVYHKTKSLLLIQSLMIPSILRGINVAAIAPPKKGKSMGMIMPILQKIATKQMSNTRSFNPLAIILCTSWKKVKDLSESMKLFIGFITESGRLHKPKIVSAYAGNLEKKIMIPILEGCDILVITPKCLLRLLKTHEFFKLNELEIMGLDDAENLIAHHLDVLKEIFVYKRSGSTESGIEVHQVVTATNWTSGLQSFMQNEMGNMFMLTVNNPLEIAVFERLKQKLVEYDKNPIDLYQKLLTYLDMTESTIKRTIIFASDDRRIRAIHKFLVQKVTFDLKLMVGSMSAQELKLMEREWNQNRGYVNIPVLLISDEALGRSDISIFNAHTIFHADVNPHTFGCRLNFLRDQFSELSFLQHASVVQDNTICHSYLFLCAETVELTQANFLYKFLGRCHSDRPVWLQEKAIDYVLNKEKSKGINEICHQIKAKGECQFPACNKRHIVLSDVDRPLLPNRGQIKFRLLHMISPSNFYVRIMEHKVVSESQNDTYKSQYTSIKMRIMKHFTDPKNVQGANPNLIQSGFVAAIRMKDILERVMIIKMKSHTPTKVEVKLIDVGSTMTVEHSDLLTLPKELMEVPAQAVEVFVTGIRPLDNDEYYHEESRQYAQDFLDQKDIYGVIMLCIGKTIWLDSVTQLVHHKTTNICVYDKNLSVELVEQDFVEKNPGHVQKLIRLCTGKIDIWNSATQAEPKRSVPIMRKFTYTDEPLMFEELSIQGIDDFTENECTVLKVLSPNVMFLSNRDTSQSVKQMQKEVKSLIESIEAMPTRDVRVGARVLFCVDSEWLRGYVLSMDGGVLLYSLDWGSLTTVSLDECTLKKLPTEYQELPYHAIMVGLSHCSHGQPFSDDVNSVIENFVTGASKKILVSVSAYSAESVDQHALFCAASPGSESALLDLDIFLKMKRFSVSICKQGQRWDEELFDVLVRRGCVTPAQSWVHIVLPESQPFISRLERSGSIAHMGSDMLTTRDSEKRLKISLTMERIIIKNISFFEHNEFVPRSVDGILNTLLVLLHFIEDQPVFMSIYRSLTALLNLAYKSKLPLCNTRSEEEFSISYICTILYSYQSAMFHILNHLNMTMRSGRITDGEIFLDMLKLLLVNTCFVNNFFEEESWVAVMAACVGAMRDEERLYNLLMDILVQLVMLSQNDTPFLAGVLRQCCMALHHSQSPSVWNSSLALINCLINSRVYQSLFRDLDFFTTLFDKAVQYFEETRCWTEMHETALDMLTSMWRCDSVDRRRLVRQRCLSDAVRQVCRHVPANETLARFLTDIVLEESSLSSEPLVELAPLTTRRGDLPDADAADWIQAKDKTLLKKHKKSFRKIFQNNNAEESDDDDQRDSIESDSDTSDLEVTAFLHKNNHNPADEDNVMCYDRP